jgi:hypothetical protein
VIEAAVRFVAAQVGGSDRILATHYRLDDGSCAGCITTMARWPCSAAQIATSATRAINDPESLRSGRDRHRGGDIICQ